jgi:catechol 2,3-dioxygenase-like lactoylglutathione lyase family enzyme
MDLTMKLELVPVPVSDIDRSKTFYVERLGFVLDVDVEPGPGVRIVQLTPPGSACSILLSTGLPDLADMTAGTGRGLHLVVDGIEAVRDELIGRDVPIGGIEDNGGVKYAVITDPDGNTFVLQEMEWRTGAAY